MSACTPIQPTLHYLDCPDANGSHRMAYWAWGNPSASHVVICVHGLSRQGRDFDVLAQALCARAPDALRVICPDVVGRGQSDALKDPMGYQVPTYAADLLRLMGALQAQTLDWVGTSMGGLIGMAVLGQTLVPLPTPVRRLVLNDVGPALELSAVQRIGQYLGQPARYASLQEAADALWARSPTFGSHTPEQWLELSRHMVKPATDGQGGWVLHYDLGVAQAFATFTAETASQGEAALWALYDNIKAQTLLTRGAQSDLLTPQTALAMTQRGPKAQLVEFAGVGHAPMFVASDQVQVVCDFLLGAA